MHSVLPSPAQEQQPPVAHQLCGSVPCLIQFICSRGKGTAPGSATPCIVPAAEGRHYIRQRRSCRGRRRGGTIPAAGVTAALELRVTGIHPTRMSGTASPSTNIHTLTAPVCRPPALVSGAWFLPWRHLPPGGRRSRDGRQLHGVLAAAARCKGEPRQRSQPWTLMEQCCMTPRPCHTNAQQGMRVEGGMLQMAMTWC
jgi:hypothetical protein